MERWKKFEERMIEKNVREHREEEETVVEQKVTTIREDKVKKTLTRRKKGEAVGSDDISVEV